MPVDHPVSCRPFVPTLVQQRQQRDMDLFHQVFRNTFAEIFGRRPTPVGNED